MLACTPEMPLVRAASDRLRVHTAMTECLSVREPGHLDTWADDSLRVWTNMVHSVECVCPAVRALFECTTGNFAMSSRLIIRRVCAFFWMPGWTSTCARFAHAAILVCRLYDRLVA